MRSTIRPSLLLDTTTKPYITFDHVDEGDDPNGVPLDAANLTNEQKHSGKVRCVAST